jgi:octaprenyl-diphosphate synthase
MDTQYTRRIEKIEAELDKWLPEDPDLSWMARVFPGFKSSAPGDAARSLTRPGRDLLKRGGKRWRPLLMLLVCESSGGGEAALPLTPLIEFCHNASLIHDDIEDSSGERRGKPSVHLIYGVDAAINSGAFLYFLPLACVEAWQGGAAFQDTVPGAVLTERKNAVFQIWGEYMRRLHLGQAMDIHWHRDFFSLPKIEDYYTMCGLKTGCLAALAAVLGVHAVPGLPAGEREKLALNFGTAAEKLGVGFQILDDVKNLTTGIQGKKRGDDIVEGKKSLPVLLYLHRYAHKRGFAAECFTAARAGGAGVSEVEALIAELEKAGVLREAEEKGLALVEEGKKLFAAKGIAPRTASLALLAGLADLIS